MDLFPGLDTLWNMEHVHIGLEMSWRFVESMWIIFQLTVKLNNNHIQSQAITFKLSLTNPNF